MSMIIDGEKRENKLLAFRRGFAAGQRAKDEGADLKACDIVDHYMRHYGEDEGWRYRHVNSFRQAWIEGFVVGNDANNEPISEGKPFAFIVSPKEDEKIESRNRLRVDALGQYFMNGPKTYCNLLPLDETAKRYRYERGGALELYANQFGCCTGDECRSCPIVKEKYPELGQVFVRSVV